MKDTKMKEINNNEFLDFKEKPQLILSQKVQNEINYLHKKFPGIEWSGELICKEEGSLNDIGKFKLTAIGIFFIDIGTVGFTGYNRGEGSWKSEDINNMFDTFPELETEGYKCHHIHSH